MREKSQNQRSVFDFLSVLCYCFLGVAKCRASWVVGRGRGSWLNVVGKKSVEKNAKVKVIEKKKK